MGSYNKVNIPVPPKQFAVEEDGDFGDVVTPCDDERWHEVVYTITPRLEDRNLLTKHLLANESSPQGG